MLARTVLAKMLDIVHMVMVVALVLTAVHFVVTMLLLFINVVVTMVIGLAQLVCCSYGLIWITYCICLALSF